jgi:MGT family glycosyltransferase
MSRFLFVVPPLTGHTNPAVSVAQAVRDLGHEVAWVAYPGVVGHLLPAGARIFAAGDAGGRSAFRLDRDAQRGVGAVKYLWERFYVPVAEEMAPVVAEAINQFRADVVVADQQAYAGACVAERTGTPWVTSATTSIELFDPLSAAPPVAEWVRATMENLAERLGVPRERIGAFDPQFSPLLTVVYSTEALTGPVTCPHPVVFVGAALSGRPAGEDDFPWPWLDRYERVVLISMGTESGDIAERFLDATLDAVADQAYGAVVVGPDELAARAPANVLVRPRVPQLALLPRVSTVVSHGGHNTVCETLAHGIPLVVAPIRDDQPAIAAQVAAAGAGIRLRFARAKAPEIRKAIDDVLNEPSYRERAGEVGRSLVSAGGATAAAHHLFDVVASRLS